ncbi:hypothetical protein [uncultured Methanobrevibacter sp.]|uniref:hypothetical protein n=1 Tax=uncultured Methanobrevibacter sp. TaxID=253161 RepID=UPI0025FA2C8B|nr:hypothetical protein [uncultured Methanobrevibacter sp.]
MTFIDLKAKSEYSRYWRPEVGEFIEGLVVNEEHDSYGNLQIVLKVGEDENGEDLLTTLPSHRNLRRFYNEIKGGDYIRVEVTKAVKLKGTDNIMFVYKVGIDPERSISKKGE